jgi:hypothetical protein
MIDQPGYALPALGKILFSGIAIPMIEKILNFFPTMQNKYIGILQKIVFLFYLQRYKINIVVFSKK